MHEGSKLECEKQLAAVCEYSVRTKEKTKKTKTKEVADSFVVPNNTAESELVSENKDLRKKLVDKNADYLNLEQSISNLKTILKSILVYLFCFYIRFL